MKRNAEHSATTTKFVVEKIATNHFEKKKGIRKERTEKKEKKGKEIKEKSEKKENKKSKKPG